MSKCKSIRLVNKLVATKELSQFILDTCLKTTYEKHNTSRVNLWSRDGDTASFTSTNCTLFVLYNVSNFLKLILDEHMLNNEHSVDIILPDFEQRHINNLLHLVHHGQVPIELGEDVELLRSLCSSIGIHNVHLETFSNTDQNKVSGQGGLKPDDKGDGVQADQVQADEIHLRSQKIDNEVKLVVEAESNANTFDGNESSLRLRGIEDEDNFNSDEREAVEDENEDVDDDVENNKDNENLIKEEESVKDDNNKENKDNDKPDKSKKKTRTTSAAPSSKPKPRRRVYMSDLPPSELRCCGKQFSHLYKLKLHQLIHSSSPPFVCSLCGKGFNNKYKMRRHEKNHPSKTEKKALDLVKAKDRTLEEEQQDEEVKNGNESLKCDGCGRTDFESRTDLKRHLNREHPSLKPFLCSLCGKAFRREKALLLHVAKSCGTKSTSFSCSMCPSLSFSSSSELRKHMLLVHKQSNTKKEVCDECGVACSSTKSLRIHKRVTHDVTQSTLKHACNLCNKRFLKFAYLQDHYNRFHCDVKLFGCSVCPKRFATQQDLSRHARTTHQLNINGSGNSSSVNEKMNFKCETCSRVFSHRATFAQHVRSHANLRPYKCVPCDKSFVAYGALKKHQLSHQRQGDRTRIFSAPRGSRGSGLSYIDLDPCLQESNEHVRHENELANMNDCYLGNNPMEQMVMTEEQVGVNNMYYNEDPYASHLVSNVEDQVGFDSNMVDCFYDGQNNYWVNNTSQAHPADYQEDHMENYGASHGMQPMHQETMFQQANVDDQMESESIAMAIMGLFSDQQEGNNQVQLANDYYM